MTGFFDERPGGARRADLQGPYTALPRRSSRGPRRPRHAFQDLAAAAIIVLLVILILVNTIAIVLRNRYERKW